MDIVKLYGALRDDPRLQKSWEALQPRFDRAFEVPLIGRMPREMTTAAVLAIKLKFEPAAAKYIHSIDDRDLVGFTRGQGAGGSRLAKILTGKTPADRLARAAARHALDFYRCRTRISGLIQLAWSKVALRAIADCPSDQLFNPAFRPTWSVRKANAISQLAWLLLNPATPIDDFNVMQFALQDIPRMVPERADAVAMFAFRRPWPIVDENLWRLLTAHRVITEEQTRLQTYETRRRAFALHWNFLTASSYTDGNELAATLYLWSHEAMRHGYRYH